MECAEDSPAGFWASLPGFLIEKSRVGQTFNFIKYSK